MSSQCHVSDEELLYAFIMIYTFSKEHFIWDVDNCSDFIGVMPTDAEKEKSKSGLSSPALLLSIFQGCIDQSFNLKIVETLMTYKRNVCGDLLYVMAYGTKDVLEPAIHMLNRYCPAVDIGMYHWL